jgi:hypothetical protein
LNEEDLKKLKLKVGFTGLIDKQPQTGTTGVEGCFADNQTTGIQVEKYSSTLSSSFMKFHRSRVRPSAPRSTAGM